MKILIGTPAYNGQVNTTYLQSVLALAQHQLPIVVDNYQDSLITRGRNSIVSRFLRDESFTHLFWIDSDIGFSVDQFCRLVDSPHLVSAAAYPFKHLRWRDYPVDHPAELMHYVVNMKEPNAPIPEDKFVQVLDAATGFMCIKRPVFDALKQAYPDLSYDNDVLNGAKEEMWLFFDTMIENGRYLSEDYAFCRRWQAIGGEIWLDLDSKLSHTGPVSFEGNLLLTNELFVKKQPAEIVAQPELLPSPPKPTRKKKASS